jgi:hypothetical protein
LRPQRLGARFLDARLGDFFALATVASTRLPLPVNVALAGSPKTAGCGEGAALHASPVVHGGGETGGSVWHGAEDEQTCAS